MKLITILSMSLLLTASVSQAKRLVCIGQTTPRYIKGLSAELVETQVNGVSQQEIRDIRVVETSGSAPVFSNVKPQVLVNRAIGELRSTALTGLKGNYIRFSAEVVTMAQQNSDQDSFSGVLIPSPLKNPQKFTGYILFRDIEGNYEIKSNCIIQ